MFAELHADKIGKNIGQIRDDQDIAEHELVGMLEIAHEIDRVADHHRHQKNGTGIFKGFLFIKNSNAHQNQDL